MHPHVGVVLRRDVVGEPLVRTFMHDDEIPFEPESGARTVATAIAVAKTITIRDGRLMLHAGVRDLDEFIAVLVPRVRSEPVLEALHHRAYLRPLSLRVGQIVVERPVVERQVALEPRVHLAVVRVVPRSHGDRVVVDRIDDEPFVRRRAVGMASGAAQPPIRHVDQRVRHGDRHALAVRFVGLRVLVRPPCRRPHPLIGGDHPWALQRVGAPGEAALPRRVSGDQRTSAVVHHDRLVFTGALHRREPDEKRGALAAKAKGSPILHHAVDTQRLHQIDLHLARRATHLAQHTIGDAVAATEAAVARRQPHTQVVEGDIPPVATGRGERAAQRIGATGFWWRRRRRCARGAWWWCGHLCLRITQGTRTTHRDAQREPERAALRHGAPTQPGMRNAPIFVE